MREDSLFGSIRGPYSTDPCGLELALVESRLVNPDSAPRLGRFILLEPVGRGGMGTVFAAFDPQLERKVAVKILHPQHSSDRLLQEAKALAKVEDHNILTIYEVGEHQGRAYIAMELLDGHSLGELQRRQRVPWRRWVQLYSAAGRGLDSAHRAGLVHRDFKPDNVLVARDGRVVVADFGLASEAPTLRDSSLGHRRHLEESFAPPRQQPGTVLYMAPEQLSGGVCDARSDQYSFCLALWQAMHGEVPLVPRWRYDLRAWQSLGLKRQRTPLWVRRLLLRGLHPDPNERWPSMQALVEQLQRDPGRQLRRAALVVMIGLLIVAVACTVFRLQSGWARAEEEAQRAEEEAQRAEADARKKALALAATESELFDASCTLGAMRERDPTIAASLLAAVRDTGTPQWRNVALNKLLRPLSRTILRGHTEELRGVAFSPGGEHVVTASLDNTIRQWRTDGTGEPRVLAGHTGDVHIVQFSRDGRVIASASRDGTVRVWDASDPAVPRVLTGHTGPVWFVDFSPDGDRLVSGGDHGEIFLWERRKDGAALDFERVTEARFDGHRGDVFHVEVSADGRLLISAGADGTARIWSLERPALLHTLRHDKGRVLRAHFSLDGARVVTAPSSGPAHVWAVAGGTLLHVLGPERFGVQDARFDGTGRYIATAGNDGDVKLWSADRGHMLYQRTLDAAVSAIAFTLRRPAGGGLRERPDPSVADRRTWRVV
ncbi:WD40 repeat domain-containing serine/threonine protein kinase [Nannocystis pusilla]|uniref:WD40 repeat domain-containing serine/threonine protein kinase n=1 Tax=Nannocystis pusilla TaxID=889268 RepID=UPI003B82A9A6